MSCGSRAKGEDWTQVAAQRQLVPACLHRHHEQPAALRRRRGRDARDRRRGRLAHHGAGRGRIRVRRPPAHSGEERPMTHPDGRCPLDQSQDHAGGPCRHCRCGTPRTGSTRTWRSARKSARCAARSRRARACSSTRWSPTCTPMSPTRSSPTTEGQFGKRLVAGAFVFSAGLGLVATNCVNAFSLRLRQAALHQADLHRRHDLHDPHQPRETAEVQGARADPRQLRSVQGRGRAGALLRASADGEVPNPADFAGKTEK